MVWPTRVVKRASGVTALFDPDIPLAESHFQAHPKWIVMVPIEVVRVGEIFILRRAGRGVCL